MPAAAAAPVRKRDGIVQKGQAPLWHTEQGPVKGEQIAVCVVGMGAVKEDGITDVHAEVRAGVGQWAGVAGVDEDRIRCAVYQTVIDDELRLIAAGKIQVEFGKGGVGIKKTGLTALRYVEQISGEPKGISVEIERSAAVEIGACSCKQGLIVSGNGNGR